MARTLTVTKAVEKPKRNPARFRVAETIYDAVRNIGVDPPWLALSGAALDKWLLAADLALATMCSTEVDAIPNWQQIQSGVEELEYQARALRREIEDIRRGSGDA